MFCLIIFNNTNKKLAICIDCEFVLFLASETNVSYFIYKRKLADKVSAAGYYVVVPDFIWEPFVFEDIANNPLEVWLKDHGTVGSRF